MNNFVTINQNYLNAYFIDNDNRPPYSSKTDKKSKHNAQHAVSAEGKNLQTKKDRISTFKN